MMCTVIAVGAFAQGNPSVVSPQHRQLTKNMSFNKAKYNASKNRLMNPSVASSQCVWFSYAVAMDSLNGHLGSGAGIQSNYLFWDSLPLADFGTSWAAPWNHNLGDVVDLTSSNLENYGGIPANWGTFNSYSVDSMSIVYAYERHFPNPATVDTLIVSLYTNVTAANLPYGYFTAGQLPTINIDFGTDTLGMKLMKYTYTSNSANAVGKVMYRIPLTVADTAITFYREKFFATPGFTVPAGNKLFASTVTFRPGHAYALGDTLNTEMNMFFFTAYEENGAGTYPYYQDCNSNSSACDWNDSYTVTTDVRYNISTGWNGYFIPKYAYTQPYTLENHLISYHVCSNNVSVNEASGNDNILYQNMPNPSNGTTTIGYELLNGGNVSLDVMNITGQNVYTLNEGKRTAGKYAVDLNLNNLQSGVYFYTLTVDGNKTTKKMTIIK